MSAFLLRVHRLLKNTYLWAFAILPVLIAVACPAGDVRSPERKVENNFIVSVREPKVRIELPKSVQYVGADRWLLYDIADCELHGFVEADSQRKVAQLYWIQFEGYVSTRPELKYQYDSTRRATVGGLEFIVDTFTRGKDDKMTSSDREHLKALIEAKGYTLPENMMSVRLVHLLNEQKRRELMIIYAEDLAPTSFTAGDLQKGGKGHDEWPTIEKGLIERAERKIVISTP